MSNKIVVVGSSNTDMIVKVPRIPKPGETILGGTFSTAAGGKGANQAAAAARAGGDVTFIARVGKDIFGKLALDGFKKDGINIDYVLRDKELPSGVALIFVAENGENSIAVASGANSNLSPEDIFAVKDIIANADILVMQLETPIETVAKAALIAFENGVRVILDPAPAQPLSDDVLRHISILTPNESESEILTGIKVKTKKDAENAACALIEKGVETVLITMGEKGVFVANSNISELITGCSVKAVDTTAAGDVFNGALAVALTENKSLHDSVLFANAAAALSVTKLGAQPSAPRRDEIEEFRNNLFE